MVGVWFYSTKFFFLLKYCCLKMTDSDIKALLNIFFYVFEYSSSQDPWQKCFFSSIVPFGLDLWLDLRCHIETFTIYDFVAARIKLTQMALCRRNTDVSVDALISEVTFTKCDFWVFNLDISSAKSLNYLITKAHLLCMSTSPISLISINVLYFYHYRYKWHPS